MKLLSSLCWKAYYKLKFGKEYQTRMQNTALLCNTIAQSSVGNLSAFYDANGQQIRGWYKREARHVRQHPLITKYAP